MNRIIILIIALIFLNQCSFKENSRIWKDKENKLDAQKNIKKVFLEDKKITSEFNQELKLDLSIIKFNNKIIDNENNKKDIISVIRGTCCSPIFRTIKKRRNICFCRFFFS